MPGDRDTMASRTADNRNGLNRTFAAKLTSFRDTPKSCQIRKARLVNLRCISTMMMAAAADRVCINLGLQPPAAGGELFEELRNAGLGQYSFR